MASTPTRTSDTPPRRDALDDTIPAAEPRDEPTVRPADLTDTPGRAPIRPTMPLDRYRAGKELGRGGMGRVVEAFDVQLGRTVALKEVLAEAGTGTTRRFAREIHITARLEHQSIVPLYDSGITSEGKPFYVMRRVTGKPLDELITRCRDLDERLTLLPSVLAAIDAVAHAHTRGVIHRDLKPQNILVGEHGETVVIDWGLAKVVGEQDEEPAAVEPDGDAGESLHTQIGSVFGTPGFMAPEQARGEATDLQGDVYALGAVLYQLLAAAPPVAGVSATEVMDKTRTHDIRPLSETAPGAPGELVAIVGKALEFDPARRYPDAGALGEDVRRFTTGQLVAAHDYTTMQRLGRFARRHRGALWVMALATVAVAVMSWIGVHRILTERDNAERAREAAAVGKREAEDARDRLAERHDALIVMQAKALLDANPTEAMAVLKQLSPSSPRIGDARAIGQSAATRGVAWALESTHELTTMVSLDPDGRLLVQVSRDGMVRVFDLERRRLLVAKAFAPLSRANWIAGPRLLVSHHAAAPQLFDPIGGGLESLALEPVEYVTPTKSGDRAIVVMPGKTAGIFDAAKQTITPIAFPEPVEQAEIAEDGSWLGVASHKLLVVYDKDGKELTRRIGDVARFTGSRFGSLAVQVDLDHILECKLDPKPVWTELPLAAHAPAKAIDFAYRGKELAIYLTNNDVMGWNHGALYRKHHVERYAMHLSEGGDDTLVVPSADGKLYWVNDVARGALALPGVVDRMRVTARAGSRYVVAAGDGVVTVFDLSAVMPERFPTDFGARAMFVDDDTLLYMRSMAAPWEWRELATGKITKVASTDLILPVLWDLDPEGGRVLVRDQGPKGVRFLVMRKNQTKPEVVVEGEKAWARLVPGDAVMYALGDGRLFAKIASEPAKQVATLDGVVLHGAGLGYRTYAAHSTTGEIVRGDLVTGKLERTRVPMGTSGFLARDGAGRVLIVEDSRLLLWDGPVTEIAKFDKEIARVVVVDGGVAIQVGSESELHVLELPATGRPQAPHRVIPSSASGAYTSQDGKLLAALGTGNTVTLVELPSRARWTLPALYTAQQLLDVAPSARKVLQATDTALVIWRLPELGSDFPAWLDNETNATVDADGVLAWPWQVKRTP